MVYCKDELQIIHKQVPAIIFICSGLTSRGSEAAITVSCECSINSKCSFGADVAYVKNKVCTTLGYSLLAYLIATGTSTVSHFSTKPFAFTS
jgi:hypothetical protein